MPFIQGRWVILDHQPLAIFFKNLSLHTVRLHKDALTIIPLGHKDPSLHYRSFGRSLSHCLHRALKLSGALALAA